MEASREFEQEAVYTKAAPDDDIDRLCYKEFVDTHVNHDILSRDQEALLSRRIQAGLQMKDQIDGLEEITPEQKQVIERGELARARFFSCNIGLVVKQVNAKYAGDKNARKLPKMDLLQEGMMGMDYAITKFDPDKGFKFSTYATWWIKQRMQRYVQNFSNEIRIPVHVHQQVTKMDRNRELPEPKILEKLGVDSDELDWIRRAKDLNERMVSLNALVSRDGEAEWSEFVPSGNNIEESSEANTIGETLVGLVRLLPENEQMVIEQRYGLDGKDPRTLADIGRSLGVTKVRVGKIESTATRRLRELAISRGLTSLFVESYS